MTKDSFIEECNKLGIAINSDILNKLDTYKELLIKWNEKFNLTNIIKEEDIYLKHFYDSLCLSKAYDFTKNVSLCDFGTGAGFPGMVIAIVFNNISVTLLESNGKKISFLEEVKKILNITNVEIINDRIENYANKNRNKFDLVTCRAVSNLGTILELSTAIVKINGHFIPLKSNIDEEIIKYKNTIKEMSYELVKTITYLLPIEKSNRSIPIFKKILDTNKKYPRNYSTIINSYK